MKNKSHFFESAGVAFLFMIVLAVAAPAQTVTLGQASAAKGETADVEITIDAPDLAAAVLLRLEFDPEVLEAPQVLAGPLMEAGHTLDTYSPEPGRFNIFIGDLTDNSPFTAQSGVVAIIRFTVKADAQAEYSDVTLTSGGTPTQPVSGLLSESGFYYYDHTVTGGRVLVGQVTGAEGWEEYK